MKNNIPYNDNLYLLKYVDGKYEKDKLIDSYNELTWVEKTWEYGEGTFLLSKNDPIIPHLKTDIIVEYENSRVQMIIFKVLIDSEEGVTVELRDLRWILARRVMYRVYTFQDTPLNEFLSTVLNDNVIAPGNLNRKIDGLVFNPFPNTGTVTGQYLGEDIYSVFEKILKLKKVVWQILIEDGIMQMRMRLGVNRTMEQTDRKPIVFSKDLDNLRSSIVSYSIEDYKNAILVGGEGDGVDKKLIDYATSTAIGLNRFEMFDDANDISSETESGTLPLNEYLQLLANDGKETLTDFEVKEAFEGEVEDYSGLPVRKKNEYLFGVDYDLGDIVTFQNQYLTDSVRVMEIVHSVSASEHVVYPGFSSIKDEEEEEIVK